MHSAGMPPAVYLVVTALITVLAVVVSMAMDASAKLAPHQSHAVVSTIYGKVQGIYDTKFGVYSFKGIPFAAPPVGNLRFAPTVEVERWNTTLNATTFGPGCMALCPALFPRPDIMCTPTMSEDCLLLNIFTPSLEPTKNLPVVIFMHGGNYVGGSGGVPMYDGTTFARNRNAVIVTINYRLGIFGGLYTDTVQGNFQILDQRMSFRWVHNAIAAFGGNPNLVTIAGQSAGAFSVAIHLSSPGSRGLFQRAIIASNPFSLPAAVPELAKEVGYQVLKMLWCPVGYNELNCLRNKTVDDLMYVQTHTDFSVYNDALIAMMKPWMPVVDGDVIPYQPMDGLLSRNFTRVPIMFGTTANESVMFIEDFSHKPMDEFDYQLLLDAIFGVRESYSIRKFYGPVPEKYASDTKPRLDVILTDYLFYCPNRKVGASLTQHVDTYMYLFDKLPSYANWLYAGTMQYCQDAVCHAEDLGFIFNPFPTMSQYVNTTVPSPTPAEDELSRFIQTAWSNFALTGNPNPVPEGIVYPRFNGTGNNLVNYSTPVSILNGYRNDVCDFWDTIGYERF